MKKKLFIGSGIVLLILGAFFTPLVFAENVEGWLWGGGVTSNPSGYGGMGWISGTSNNISGDGGSLYAVDIPSGDGNVSGYAWSEHYGWIDFDPGGPYPTPPNYSVQRNGDNLEGWARILSIQNEGSNSGGWDGWIKMSGASYGVDMAKFGAHRSK